MQNYAVKYRNAKHFRRKFIEDALRGLIKFKLVNAKVTKLFDMLEVILTYFEGD